MLFRVALLMGLVNTSLSWGCSTKLSTVKARWNLWPFSGFYDIPLSTSSKKIKDYVQVTRGFSNLAINATLYCYPNDARVCWMYDAKGNIVGSQISFLKEDVKHVEGFGYNNTGSYEETNIFGTPAYSVRAYFTNPDTIPETGRTENGEVADGVWIKVDGKIVEMPREEPKESVYQDWNRQACFPGMGKHYFYKMNSTTTDCTQSTPFGLFHSNKLVGFGIPGFGTASTATRGRSWYESVPLLGVKAIMPHRPQCIDEMTSTYGLYSMHVYFVNYPMLIGCLF